jgi:hypothetical protein
VRRLGGSVDNQRDVSAVLPEQPFHRVTITNIDVMMHVSWIPSPKLLSNPARGGLRPEEQAAQVVVNTHDVEALLRKVSHAF